MPTVKPHQWAAGGEHGFGLGLAIVERIARILDHPIRVRSKIGRGSVFAIDLPLGCRRDTAERCEPAQPIATEALAGMFVGVIENEETICAGMRELLEAWGCRVVTAACGSTAVSQLTACARTPDLLIADYHLDDAVTGIAAIADVHAAIGVDIPGLTITADRSPDVVEFVRQSGLYLLHKPVKPARLRALMSHVLK